MGVQQNWQRHKIATNLFLNATQISKNKMKRQHFHKMLYIYLITLLQWQNVNSSRCSAHLLKDHTWQRRLLNLLPLRNTSYKVVTGKLLHINICHLNHRYNNKSSSNSNSMKKTNKIERHITVLFHIPWNPCRLLHHYLLSRMHSNVLSLVVVNKLLMSKHRSNKSCIVVTQLPVIIIMMITITISRMLIFLHCVKMIWVLILPLTTSHQLNRVHRKFTTMKQSLIITLIGQQSARVGHAATLLLLTILATV